jgi:uncharacterized repeat protein (TIGR01451 family)
MSRGGLLYRGASVAAGLLLIGGCASNAPAPVVSAAPPTVSAGSPSTQPVISSCVNDTSVEFDSSWSTFRFASQSNPVTVKLTAPAPPIIPPPATMPTGVSQPTGASEAGANRGGDSPDALRGGASIDAVRGSARADALRGYAVAEDARGAAPADAARGSFTVQVLRGSSEAVSARHDNSSAVVRPDLAVALKADPVAAAPGDTVVYTVSIKNVGSIEARDVTITDYLPEQMEIFSARGATIAVDPDDSSTHLTVPGTIPPGKSVEVQLLARVKAPAGHP